MYIVITETFENGKKNRDWLAECDTLEKAKTIARSLAQTMDNLDSVTITKDLICVFKIDLLKNKFEKSKEIAA